MLFTRTVLFYLFTFATFFILWIVGADSSYWGTVSVVAGGDCLVAKRNVHYGIFKYYRTEWSGDPLSKTDLISDISDLISDEKVVKRERLQRVSVSVVFFYFLGCVSTSFTVLVVIHVEKNPRMSVSLVFASILGFVSLLAAVFIHSLAKPLSDSYEKEIFKQFCNPQGPDSNVEAHAYVGSGWVAAVCSTLFAGFLAGISTYTRRSLIYFIHEDDEILDERRRLLNEETKSANQVHV